MKRMLTPTDKSLENSEKHLSASNAGQVTTPIRILVVDDEETLRSFIGNVLKDEGYEVTEASSGEEALEKVKQISFDLMLTDVKMSGIDGIQLLKMVKHIDMDCIVIVMTGYASVETSVEAMKSGAADYITKPFNIDQIKIVVSKTLEKRRLERESREGEFYKELSRIDGLTGLYNHRHFHQLLESEIARSIRYNHPLSLIMLDIDYFKTYNDLNGHPAGDMVLEKIAWVIKQSIRTCDLAARYGGEEFAIIVPETDKEGAAVLARRLGKLVEETQFDREQVQPGGKLTVSLGLASYPLDAIEKKDLIEKADQALYQAKESGRNRLVVFNPDQPLKPMRDD